MSNQLANTPLAPRGHDATSETRALRAVAVDLGGSQVRVAVCDASCEVVAEVVDSSHGRPLVEILEQICETAQELATGTPLCAAGVGIPGVIDPTAGTVSRAPNLIGGASLDVRGYLSQRLGIPIVVENDLNMAAIGEGRRGGARGRSDYVFLAIGTGVGIGIVADGTLIRGACGGAGEVAWLPFGGDPFDTTAHARGAVEQSVGGAALARRYEELTGARVTGSEVFAAAARGDSVAQRLLADQLRTVGLVVRSVACMLEPELIVVGGGIGSRDGFLEALRAELVDTGVSVPPLRSSLLGERAALTGAAVAALDLVAEPQ